MGGKSSNLILVRIDENYCDFLREHDNRVIFNSADKNTRPFVGVVFSVNGLNYFAPLSSPKQNYTKRNNSPIFQKIMGGALGAIRLNSMLPVPNEFVKTMDLQKYCLTDVELKYQNMLKKQIRWINNNVEKITEKAQRLHTSYCNGTLSPYFTQFCCDFKLLEEQCMKFMEKNNIEKASIDTRLQDATWRANEANRQCDALGEKANNWVI